jgi:hypothetical protein
MSILTEGKLTFMGISHIVDPVHPCSCQDMRSAWYNPPALQRSHQMSNNQYLTLGIEPPYLPPGCTNESHVSPKTTVKCGRL